jgi:hypothetical protein
VIDAVALVSEKRRSRARSGQAFYDDTRRLLLRLQGVCCFGYCCSLTQIVTLRPMLLNRILPGTDSTRRADESEPPPRVSVLLLQDEKHLKIMK